MVVLIDMDVEQKSPTTMAARFNRIANQYDQFNQWASLGMHHRWRAAMLAVFPSRQSLDVLDLATGTADVLIDAAQAQPNQLRSGCGLDISADMLAIGREKIQAAGLSSRLRLQEGDATAIPHEAASFDVVSIAFGIRNMTAVSTVLSEAYRVLRPQGRLVILEFSTPTFWLWRWGHAVVLRTVMPLIGWVLTRERSAFAYLDQSIRDFPSGPAFCQAIDAAGFTQTACQPLCLGAVSVYVGQK